MSRFLFVCLVLSITVGCTAKYSKTTAAHKDLSGECGWFIVDEQTSTTFLGLTLTNKNNEFHDQLYYCCPQKNTRKPGCIEASWRAHRSN